jgi:hypothetical protein
MDRLRKVLVIAIVFALSMRAQAKNPEEPETAQPPGTQTTFIDHSLTGPFWFGAEMNSIFQVNPGFSALYSGTNSFGPDRGAAVSGLFTVFTAWRATRTTEFIVDAEMAVGGGLSAALGLAGFTNLDVVRNPNLSNEPYVARFQVHQLIPLARIWETNEDRGPISSFYQVPRHRLELRFGKMSMADLFDVNPAGSDSHLQFMNWTVDNNGAWDYAADTRGYTYALIVEYQGPFIEVRFGEGLMPTAANGIQLEWNLANAHAENLEVEIKYLRGPRWGGTVRLLGYGNHANMGSYQQAIDAYLAGVDPQPVPQPDITQHRHQNNSKYGCGINVIQSLLGVARAFARGGWNDGHNESFAYTEVDDTFEIGFDLAGHLWRRELDKVGLAFVTNGLSPEHREYLRLGGHGFVIGDACDFPSPSCVRRAQGYLNYGRENIVEGYYNLHIWRGAFVAADVQLIQAPGYNQDRGPVWVFSARGHLEF